jgi:hypothetical protein
MCNIITACRHFPKVSVLVHIKSLYRGLLRICCRVGSLLIGVLDAPGARGSRVQVFGGDVEEVGPRLARDGVCQQCLACQ